MTIYRTNAASPWIKQGDRLTKTFASGLCLIQQTYVAPKSLATYNTFMEGAAISDSQPCIDGAYIYPAPDYQDTGDGFVKCTVTAYGRWKTEPNVTRQKRKLTLGVFGSIQNLPISPSNIQDVYFDIIDYSTDTNVSFNNLDVFAEDLVLKFVTPAGANLPLTPPASMSSLYKMNGEIIPAPISIYTLTALFGGQLSWRTITNGNITYAGSSTITTAQFESVSPYDSFGAMDSGIVFTITRCDSVDYGYFSEYTASFEASGTSFTKHDFLFRKI